MSDFFISETNGSSQGHECRITKLSSAEVLVTWDERRERSRSVQTRMSRAEELGRQKNREMRRWIMTPGLASCEGVIGQ